VYERNAPAVVNITSAAVTQSASGQSQVGLGNGTGVIVDDQGHIVTNNHVIEDATQLGVTFQRGVTVPAELVGRDPDNDLAVIRVDPQGHTADGAGITDLLQPATLGDSDNVTIGSTAIAMGSPLGLQQTVTEGIVSAIRNPLEDSIAEQIELLGGVVQTDAAINPGNSGGPLFNAAGEVIGINVAILSGSGGNIGIGFAIPVDVVKRVAPELIQNGCYRHPYLGVTTIALSRLGTGLKQQLGIPPNQMGLLVQESSAAAAQAGIRGGTQTLAVGSSGVTLQTGGDLILAVDGRPLASAGELRAYVENTKRPGDTITVTISRDGQEQPVQVQLRQRPDQQDCP
jgi:2-alkenal reductase